MKQLIPVQQSTVNHESIPTVNARDLHAFLGVNKDFSAWVKVQITRARLTEGRDFITSKAHPKGGAVGNRGVTIDYHLTIDAGKHIAMMSGTDKGFEVRDYFIECEKRLRQTEQRQLPATYAEALRQLADSEEAKEKLLLENKVLAPKAEFYDAVTGSTDAIDMANAAKVLAVPNLGRNTLFLVLRNLGILQHDNQPYQAHVDNGNFRVIEQKYTKQDGSTHISMKTVVYQKGLDYIRKIIAHNMHDGYMTAPARWAMPGKGKSRKELAQVPE